jgi:predicted N-acetyltransferase YhbS
VRVAERLLAAVRYRGDPPVALPGYWLLSSLGVARSFAGQGAGGAMVACYCENARRAGAPGVYLLTDASDNDATQRFYARNGFTVHSTQERPDGRRLLILIRSFPK